MDELVTKLQHQLDQAIKLADKVHRQKSYLVDLLIKDTSFSTTAIINQYLNWLEENEG
jgi:enamine deaminase RidA (YjgF/YER057c/UK114 family)